MADGKVVISTALDNGGLEKGLKGIAGQFGGLGKVVGSVATAIAGAFAAATVAITKQAVDAYADYEQLVGGVETLFKDASGDVIKYAENAFRTVGLSANEYMETVTGFSASLISSLGGDTAKAAKVADMALTDMADNANKMGTALESIKTAYQGFAKGQYQLLDNLKVGYGGSKTEMERLLTDAQAITGVKYDISNLADVYNAIHAIQEKLGIAGATAAEAEGTISGSASMTAAAWKNVLTAISGGGDIDRAVNNLVYSLTKYFENIVPVVRRSLVGIGEVIEKVAPMLVEMIASALIKALPSLISAVQSMIVGLAKGIYQGIAALLSGRASAVKEQLNDMSDGADALADSYDAVADSAEAAAKAQRSLAGFDEITKLSGSDTNEAGSVTMPSVNIPVSTDIQGAAEAVQQVSGFVAELKNLFEPLKEPLKDLFAPLREDVQLVWNETLKPFSDWISTTLLPLLVTNLAEGIKSLSTAWEAVRAPLAQFWQETLKPIIDQVGTWIEEIVVQTTDSFGYLSDKIAEYKDEIGMVIEGIGAVLQVIWAVISPVINSAVKGIGNVLKTTIDWIFGVIQAVGNFFAFIKNIFGAIGSLYKGNFDEAGKYAKEALGNFVNIIIGMANAMISVVNNLWTLIFDAFKSTVNSMGGLVEKFGEFLGFDWNLQWNATAPLIPTIPKYVPALAQGAVLPPNKPFLAMVGDQRHGTNVEAPLETIQEAVALVMEDMIRSNMAGHEATVAVLKEILEAVLGIHIGDDVVGQAVARYNAKMAVIRGGA